VARLRLARWASGLAAVIAVPMLISCGGGGEAAETTTTGAREATGTGAAEATTTETRCLSVSRAVTRALQKNLTTSGGPWRIERAAAVRSDDFKKVYFISAVIDGTGIDDVIGTWATKSLSPRPTDLIPAESIADEFSTYTPDQGGSSKMDLGGLDNDGAQESRDCLE
jgi:hypothetical protein